MKTKPSISFRSYLNKLLAMLLPLLGFSACEDGILGGGNECMYGTPHAKLTVLGTVKTTLTSIYHLKKW